MVVALMAMEEEEVIVVEVVVARKVRQKVVDILVITIMGRKVFQRNYWKLISVSTHYSHTVVGRRLLIQ